MNDQRINSSGYGLPRGWKTRARQLCREIIARTPDGTPVHADDAEFVRAILALHPDAAGKIGCGVAGFTTATDKRYRTGRHFVLLRVDGTSTDFSWTEAITPTGHVQKIRNAMRVAIEPQILAFRDAQDPLACALDAAHPGPYHVDHAGPLFQELADAFAAEPAFGGYTGLTLAPHQDGDISDQLVPGDAFLWQLYHQANARLRILCRACNCNHRGTQ